MKEKPVSGMRTFLIIWSGQVVSLVGSGLTGFALGVWVFLSTGSATQFALMTFCGALPAVLLSPFTGVLVDRWDRRWAMLLGDFAAGLSTVVLIFLVWFDMLEVWHIYCVIAALSVFGGLQSRHSSLPSRCWSPSGTWAESPA